MDFRAGHLQPSRPAARGAWRPHRGSGDVPTPRRRLRWPNALRGQQDVLAGDAARAVARAGACAAKADALAARAADADADPSVSSRAVAANTAAAYAAQTIVTASGAPNAARAAARAASYIDRRIHDAAGADLRRLLALDLGSFPELGAVIDPGEDGPLGPLWPTHAHDISEEAVFAHSQTPLITHS